MVNRPTKATNAVSGDGVGLVTEGRTILSDISFELPTGTTAALLGPNGSGKTTLLRLMTGYLFPTVGAMEILGERLGETDVDTLRRRIGLVDPTTEYLEANRLTALEVVISGNFGHWMIDFDRPTPEQVERSRAMLAEVGLADRHRQIFRKLSTGEQRRVLLARALSIEPELLILDEPTAGLDLRGRETLLATVTRLANDRPHMTTLMVTHHLEELLPGTERVLLLSDGRLFQHGSPTEVLTESHLSKVFGMPVHVTRHGDRWSWRVHAGAWQGLIGGDPGPRLNQ